MRRIEIESLAEFDALVARNGDLSGCVIQGVDLSQRAEVLAAARVRGAIFLGGEVPDVDDLRERGALVFPTFADLPFDPYRAALYSPAELYDRLPEGYEHTPDAGIYAWHQRTHPSGPGGLTIADAIAMSLHDTAIDNALAEWLSGRRVVGVMGGHAIGRDEPTYAATARLGLGLADKGLAVATGGGPGLMEAANLGARCRDDGELRSALARLATVPSFEPSISAWARTALDLDLGERETLGVPTWFYGHEPPNAFATAIAKYFGNAVREDMLLRICNAGIVVMPGAAGTVQEIFQDACENYYAQPEAVAPMVLVGERHWTETLPAWPLLRRLAADRPIAGKIHLVDAAEDALGLLGDEG